MARLTINGLTTAADVAEKVFNEGLPEDSRIRVLETDEYQRTIVFHKQFLVHITNVCVKLGWT